MENEDKYVILGHDGQIIHRKEDEFIVVGNNSGHYLTSVFNRQEVERFKFPKTYKLVPVDFEEESECKLK